MQQRAEIDAAVASTKARLNEEADTLQQCIAVLGGPSPPRPPRPCPPVAPPTPPVPVRAVIGCAVVPLTPFLPLPLPLYFPCFSSPHCGPQLLAIICRSACTHSSFRSGSSATGGSLTERPAWAAAARTPHHRSCCCSLTWPAKLNGSRTE